MKPGRVWRRLSLRGRLMVVGVSGLVAGLLVGGVLLVTVLGSTLHRGAEDAATKTASALAELIAADSLPDPLPVSGDDVRAQVIDDEGRVVAASLGADRLVPFLYPGERPVRGGDEPHSVYIDGERIGVTGPVQVVAVEAGTPDAPRTVLVAKSLGDLVRAVDLLKHSLLIAYPLLVALLAAIAWRVIGATLRPVETLRAGAQAITDGARADRLPLPASRDEIHRLAVTLNGMLARLEGARARQRAFVADAAHELRSPLTNLRTELEVAQRIGEAPDTEDLLADVRRLGRLVDDLLLLARSDDLAGRPDPVTGPVDVGSLLAAIAARYPARVTLRPVAGAPWTVGDEAALDRVVANLVDNAVRHARERVELAAALAGDQVEITVTDDGPGIPEADRERVFDRFTRLDDARARDAGGAGLGLSIVRELVARHGGTVTLGDAAPGLVATVRLPAASITEAGPETPQPRSVQTGLARPTTPAG
ncbi:Signal transduction histidine kinase [Asanoa ishikariensis]|uniref:histidine kinase n=2 Tax=Asanoa ishikariensis TaxID=137265 RepID=A0A1H3RZQ6_9ACTN|nr:Signal transduction histidine kinase [Asanoa ishikariensis]